MSLIGPRLPLVVVFVEVERTPQRERDKSSHSFRTVKRQRLPRRDGCWRHSCVVQLNSANFGMLSAGCGTDSWTSSGLSSISVNTIELAFSDSKTFVMRVANMLIPVGYAAVCISLVVLATRIILRSVTRVPSRLGGWCLEAMFNDVVFGRDFTALGERIPCVSTACSLEGVTDGSSLAALVKFYAGRTDALGDFQAAKTGDCGSSYRQCLVCSCRRFRVAK